MVVFIPRGVFEPRPVVPQQLGTWPIEPPDPTAAQYGELTWDLASSIAYSPYQEVSTIVEARNPTGTDRLYGIAYYFVSPSGVLVSEDYLIFSAGGMDFSVFMLHAGAPEPMVTTVTFSAPSTGYRFGLRMLELEIIESMATIKYETNRLEVTLGLTSGGGSLLNDLIPGAVAVALVAASAKVMSSVSKEGGTNGRIR